MKLTFDDVLDRINDERYVDSNDVQARALDRVIWRAEWHIPGCMSESQAVCLSKREALETALGFASDGDGCAPRGMRAELLRFGRSEKIAKNAYVSMAVTTIEKLRLRDIL